MAFEAVFACSPQVLELLQRQGWASFRTLRRRFGLDEVALTALTQALLDTQPVTVDEAGTRLVWQGELRPAAASPRTWDVVPSAPSMEGAVPWPLAGERSRGLLPLVGREQEVELLRARWAQVQTGQGQVVALSGEAGIGKSRLVQVVSAHVADTPHRRWACHGAATTQYSAFAPVIDLLQQVLDYQPDDPPGVRLHKLETTLVASPLSLSEAVPLLAALLAVPLDDRYPPLLLTPARQRQQTLETVLTVLRWLAVLQPVLLIVEDLHWVDPSTLELLGLLMAQAATARLYVLLTWRPEFQPPWLLPAHLTALTLGRLLPMQVEQMATHVAGGKALPPAVLQQIVTKTEGVPLVVEELTQMVLASGLVREEADGYALTGPLPPLAIPPTVHESLLARLEQLGEAQAVAQVGAVWGRGFTEGQLQAVAPLDRRRLEQALARLVAADILREVSIPPRVTYVFKHALIQEVAYASLLKRTRQQYHRQIAHVLETQFPETAEHQPELLARHYTEAGLYEQALVFWKRAGERTLARSAYREATMCFEQALGAVQQLPDSRDTHEQAIDLRLALRSALLPSGDLGRLLACLREAESLAATLDDPRRLGQVSIFLSNYFYLRGAHDQAIAAAQRALALTTASGDVVLQALANQYLGFAYYAQGDYRQAIDCLGQTVASLDGAQYRERFGQISLLAVTSRARLALCHAELGTFAEGRALGEEGLRIAEAVAHSSSLMWAYYGIGLLSLGQGDLPRALPLLERAVGLCQDVDLPGYFPWMVVGLGAAYTLGGRVADAVPLLTQAMEQTTGMGLVFFQTLCHLSLGETHLLAGRLEEAHTLAEGALALAREHQERGHQAYALRLLGEIAARRDPLEHELAESYYQQALALADALGMRPLVAHCHLGLGLLYLQMRQARAGPRRAVRRHRAVPWHGDDVLVAPDGGGLECPRVEVMRAHLDMPRLVLIVNNVPEVFDVADVKARVDGAYHCEVAAVRGKRVAAVRGKRVPLVRRISSSTRWSSRWPMKRSRGEKAPMASNSRSHTERSDSLPSFPHMPV